MQDKTETQDTPPTRAGYETADVDPKWIGWFLLMLPLIGIVAYGAPAVLIRISGSQARRTDQRMGENQAAPSPALARTYFPYPREQPSPREELKDFQARTAAEMNSYGWIDQKAGIVRIPVKRAMDLISQRGLPTRAGTNRADLGPSALQLQQERSQTSPNLEDGK
jgi:hypothetical protein